MMPPVRALDNEHAVTQRSHVRLRLPSHNRMRRAINASHVAEVPLPLHSAMIGAVAGCVATLPMTAFMAAAYTALPEDEQYSLPPRQITMKLAQAAGVVHEMNEQERVEATAITHFGYGAVMGGVFGALTCDRIRPDVRTGIAFGLAVWAGSYLGVLPALRLLSPATQQPRNRNLLMIGAHVVWGAGLGCTQRALTAPER